MRKMQIQCRICQNQCEMEVEILDEDTVEVSGNGCMRGMVYAQQEAWNSDTSEIEK